MLLGGWRLATEDAAFRTCWHHPIHDSCASAETEDPEGTRNPHPPARGVPTRSQESGEGQALSPLPLPPSTSPPEHLFYHCRQAP
jgi:hypothetical protein